MRSHLSRRGAHKRDSPGILRYCLRRHYLGAALQVRENVIHEAILLGLFG
jgi:hypothetical protein